MRRLRSRDGAPLRVRPPPVRVRGAPPVRGCVPVPAVAWVLDDVRRFCCPLAGGRYAERAGAALAGAAGGVPEVAAVVGAAVAGEYLPRVRVCAALRPLRRLLLYDLKRRGSEFDDDGVGVGVSIIF